MARAERSALELDKHNTIEQNTKAELCFSGVWIGVICYITVRHSSSGTLLTCQHDTTIHLVLCFESAMVIALCGEQLNAGSF